MTNQNRSWMLFGFSLAMLAAGVIVTGMNRYPEPHPARVDSNDFSPQVVEARETLRSELQRRFTDIDNLDFGMSRVARYSRRIHVGPLMALRLPCIKAGTRMASKGQMEVYVDGKWIAAGDWRPIMMPENEKETRAIEALKTARVEVAIYTFGRFDLDQDGAEVSSLTPTKSSSYGFDDERKDTGLRARGPAYTDFSTTNAPTASEVASFARLAWASAQPDYSADGKGGWVYFSRRMSVTNPNCLGCHVRQGPIKEVGDKIGIFVIALRRTDTK